MSEEKKKQKGFTKEQLLKSKQYSGVQKDIMRIVLDDKKSYSHDQAKSKIEEFGKRRVK